jgi:hypothetical protein
MENHKNDLEDVYTDVISKHEPDYRYVTGSLRQEAIASDLQQLAERIADSRSLQLRLTHEVAACTKEIDQAKAATRLSVTCHPGACALLKLQAMVDCALARQGIESIDSSTSAKDEMHINEAFKRGIEPTRAGWVDLYTAQFLWASYLSSRHRVGLKTYIPNVDVPEIQADDWQALPKAFMREMRRMAKRAALAACHVCDVCGSGTAEVTGLPSRCIAHQNSPQKLAEIDSLELVRRRDPLTEIVKLADRYLDGLFFGDPESVASLLENSGALFTAARVRHECLLESSQWALHVAHPLLIADRSSHALPRFTSGQIRKALEGQNAAQQLLGSKSLKAAARTWARHGQINEHMQGVACEALAKADALAAEMAIEEMLREVHK